MSEQLIADIYTRVSNHFAARIHKVFSTEESLQAAHDEYFPGLPFDRTDRWNHILRKELDKVWYEHGLEVKSPLTGYDIRQILMNLQHDLDFNLFTQVYLNIEPAQAVQYASDDADAVIKDMQAKWGGKSPSPFDPKPKMFKVAASAEQQEYNRDLSTIKALSIISRSGWSGGFQSYRVSPIGSTPTLVDSANLSMLGVGADQYLRLLPGYHAFYVTWDAAPMSLGSYFGPGKLSYPGVPYPFTSKSGGDILNTSLFSRRVTALLFSLLAPEHSVSLLPRMNSVLIITTRDAEAMSPILDLLKKIISPIIEMHEGARREKALPEV
jgi:hypothetical protein